MYKVIYNNKIVDVVEYPQFVKILQSGTVVPTNKSYANGIVGSDDTLYSFEPVTKQDVKVVSIEKITSDEFSRLKNLLNSESDLIADKSVLINARRAAIDNLSVICQANITNGFDIKLSDNVQYHFDLTAEDQLNLLNIENQLNSGASLVMYHASGKPCRLFTRVDILKVISAFRKHVLYHTTYFNAAKQYINTLTEPEKIAHFAYGDDVSFTTRDLEVRRILRGTGSVV